MDSPGRIVRMKGAIGIDKVLQALKIGISVLLVVDLDADP